MHIKDYTATITLKSGVTETDIPDWSSFRVGTRLGSAEIDFSIDLNRPIDIEDGDTISISDGFEGSTFDLLVDKEIESHDGSTVVRHIRGKGSKLTRNAPQRDIIFVNQTWLDQVALGYHYKNNILYKDDPGGTPYQINGVAILRLMIPQLPGRNVKDHEFEVFLQSGISYRDIARWACQQCDLELVTNMPDLPIQKTFNVSSSEPYWNIIPRIYSKYNPFIFIKEDTLYILDVGEDNQAKPGDRHMTMTEDSFSIYNWGINDTGKIVDHIVIHGPSSKYTYSNATNQVSSNNRSEMDLPGSTLTFQREETIEYEDEDELTKLRDVDISDERPVRTVTTTKKKIDPNDMSNMVTTQETTTVYNANGDKLTETITDYKYADFRTPIGSFTEEYGRHFKVAGGITETTGSGIYQELADFEFTRIKTRELTYKDYMSDVGAVEVDDVTYEMCPVFKSQEKYEGSDYDTYESMHPIRDAMQIGYNIQEEQDDDGYGWEEKWQMTKKVTIRYDKASRYHLMKTRIETNMVPRPVTRTTTEDLPIPDSPRTGGLARRWEYYKISGNAVLYEGGVLPSGNYHPKEELQDDNVTTEAEAQKIAKRMFAKHSSQNTYGSIQTTLPLPTLMTGGTLSLPACTKKYFDWDTEQWEEVTLDANVYWITAHYRVCQYSGDVGHPQRLLKVYDELELKEYF